MIMKSVKREVVDGVYAMRFQFINFPEI